jgi:small subunit ribosomal protein S6
MTMRRYEVVYVLAPTLTEEEVDQYAETYSQAARELGAEIISVEKWEKRKLAFRVKKFWDGYYTILTIEEAAADAVTELERRFKVNDTVIRFLTVRIDEELKRAAKFQEEEAEIEPEVPEEKVAEPKESEPKKAEPKKAEVKEAEPKKAEPKEAEPKEAEPKDAEPKKAEPKKVAKKPAKKVKAPEEKSEPAATKDDPAEAESKDAAEEVPVEKPEKE